MSWVGVMMGRPLEGLKMLLGAIMSRRASNWASTDKRDVDGHLVAVEVGVVGGADQGMNANGLTFDELRLEGLDREPVQRGSAVEQHRDGRA